MKIIMEKFISKTPERFRREFYQSFSLLLMAFLKIFRTRKKSSKKQRIILIDFRYAGNLRAFFNYAKNNAIDLEFGFMPADPADYDHLSKALPKEIRLLSRLSLRDIHWAYQSDVFLTSIMMRRFLKLTKIIAPHIQFVQVFHSLNLLGEPQSWFYNMAQYDKVFCASEWVVHTFEKLTQKKKIFIPTGYAVADEFFSFEKSRSDILKELGLDPTQKTILLSPTLSSAVDFSSHESLYPYSDSFLKRLDHWAQTHKVQVIFRNHPHEEFNPSIFNGLTKIKLLNSKEYKDVSEQLHAADVMVTDLSGIGGYFMALKRPMVFLETTLAHSKEELTFFISPEELPGPRVKTIEQLLEALETVLTSQSDQRFLYKARMEEAFFRLYGNCFDGRSCERYLQNLLPLPQHGAQEKKAG